MTHRRDDLQFGMKFRPGFRIELFQDTPRKRAAFHRSMRQKREKFPLLAELIREAQPDVDAAMIDRAASHIRWQQQNRDQRAQRWRQGRARLYAMGGPNFRRRVVACWNDSPYPPDPGYFIGFLFDIERGRIDIDEPPWRKDLMTAEQIDAGRERVRQLGIERGWWTA